MQVKELLSRLLQMVITLLGVSFLTFSLTYIAPGDPVEMLLEVGDTMVSKETVEQTRHELGLDKPFIVQYGNWLKGVVTGDMGMSYSAKVPVVAKLAQGMSGTLTLAGAAMFLTIIVSVPCGVMAAYYKNKWPDYMLRSFSFVGMSMPPFWVGLLLLYCLGLKLRLFPIVGGEVSFNGVVLPAVTLAILLSSKYSRYVRTAVLEELGKDYVIGARTRGMSSIYILWHHVLPNSCLPLVTLFGLAFGWLLGGVAIIEMIFSWPGIGRLAVYSIEMRDYPMIQGVVLWIALFYMFINFVVDISYYYLDPRLSRGEHK